MAELKFDSIAIDCPDPVALATFYAGLLGVASRGDFVLLPNEQVEIWFQKVEDYQPPTWPTQERGQQIHLDVAVQDKDAMIARALELGSTLTDRRDGYHYPIMLDPAGHPFCLITADDPDTEVDLGALNFDSGDARKLAEFYQQLIGGTVRDSSGWSDVIREGELTLSFETVAGYLPPTWPTQERGQQMHIDFHTTDRIAEVSRAVSIGAEELQVNNGFTVMMDPAGHPFCICDLN